MPTTNEQTNMSAADEKLPTRLWVNVPSEISQPLVGREAVLAQLRTQTVKERKSVALVPETGKPGLGTTALAIALAHSPEVQQHFTGGILWGGLGEAADPYMILQSWADAMDIQHSSAQTASELCATLSAALRARAQPTLIVLDDARDAESIEALQAVADPNCTYLLSTYQHNLAQAFAPEATITVSALSLDDSLALLSQHAAQAVAAAPDTAGTLAKASQGHPLALTLLARLLSTRDADTLNAQAFQPADDPLIAAIRLCDQAISDTTWRAIGAFKAYPAGLDRAAVISVLSPAPETQAAAKRLDQLLALGLVNPNVAQAFQPAEDPTEAFQRARSDARYTVHPAIADYARQALGEYEIAAREHHARAYLARIEAAQANKDFEALALAWPQIHYAWTYLIDPETKHPDTPELTVAYAMGLAPFLRERHSWPERLIWAEAGLAAARTLEDHQSEAQLLLALGWAQRDAGEAKDALHTLEEAQTALQTTGDQASEAAAHHNIGLSYHTMGKSRKAFTALEQALSLYQATDDQRGQAMVLRDIGLMHKTARRPQEAQEHYEKALTIYQALDDREKAAQTLSDLAGAQLEAGLLDEALNTYEQALAAMEACGDRVGIAKTQNDMASVYLGQQQWEPALALLEQALPTLRALGDKRWVAIALNNIAGAYHGMDDWRQAVDIYEQALEIRRELNDQEGEAKTLRNLGIIYARQGNRNRAKMYLNKALVIAKRLKSRELVSVIQKSISRMPRGRR